ncbi:serine/threonine-protein kinase Chk1-like [Oratosquilla oratoria]|uniref:serine/threonine-protein kinase Chk1-like n=1 Tax=Oratosquilla oratoria TaxID=337810 RepID=UPI003F76F103
MRAREFSSFFADFENDEVNMEPTSTSRGFDQHFDRRVRAFVSVCTVMELMVLLGFFNDRIGQLLHDKSKRKDTRHTDVSIWRSLTIIGIVLDEMKRSAMHSKKRKFCELREETVRTTKKIKKSIHFDSKMTWEKVRFLGKGGFASVTLVKDATSGFVCAKKTIGIYRLERQLQEIEIHRKLQHNNVVSFLGEDRDSENLYVFLEYVNGGTLQDRIGTKGVSERRAKLYFSQLIKGVQYLHSQNVVHRDLKPENLFLTKDDDLKIGDFGIAGEFVKGEYLTKICGTSAYIAPEVFTGRYLGEPNDVWACGIVLFRLVTGQNPWQISITNKDINFGVWSYSTEEMRIQKPWKSISRKVFRLIKSILVVNPEQRATLGDIEQNAWLLG